MYNIHFLVGDIGSGKTTFISHLIFRYGVEWHKNNYWVLHIDTDGEFNHGVPTLDTAYKDIFTRIFRRLEQLAKDCNEYDLEIIRAIEDDCTPRNINDQNKEEKWQKSINYAVSKIKSTFGKKLILIIDNLDYLYHIYDRWHFSKKQNELAEKGRRFIDDFVKSFVPGNESPLSTMGVTVLIALREDSLKLLKASVELQGINPFNRSGMVFYYHQPTLYQVIIGRYKLLRYCITQVKKSGKMELFDERMSLLDRIIEVKPTFSSRTEGPKNLFQKLSALSKQGLRQTLEYFSLYTWVGGGENISESFEISARFATQHSPSILAFVTGGKRAFSQYTAAFPNIYLVDSEAASTVVGRDYLSEELLLPHRHTYWLKRLIIEYVHQKGKGVKLEDILNVFCEKDSDFGYEETIVRLATASLSQTDKSAVLRADLQVGADGDQLGISLLKLTERGKYCIEHFIDTFDYLQLVVEDSMLPLPKVVETKMDINQPDYGYLIKTQPDYGTDAALMVCIKADQVLYFLDALEASLELEKSIYPKVFDKLKKEGVVVPSINNIRGTVNDSLGKLRRYLSNIPAPTTIERQHESMSASIKQQMQDAYNAGTSEL